MGDSGPSGWAFLGGQAEASHRSRRSVDSAFSAADDDCRYSPVSSSGTASFSSRPVSGGLRVALAGVLSSVRLCDLARHKRDRLALVSPFAPSELQGSVLEVRIWDACIYSSSHLDRNQPDSWCITLFSHVDVYSQDHVDRNLENGEISTRKDPEIDKKKNQPRSYHGQSLILLSGSMCRKGHSLL